MANVMTKRGSQDNVVTYEHYCDTAEDLVNIPEEQITLGSVAIVLNDNGALGAYIANSQKEWVAVLNSGGGGTGDDIPSANGEEF